MAASAVTPKLLGRISNEKYQEKDKWKIDDIALGPANELLISGHNQKIPKTFISIHKESFGNYQNRPEFNKTLRQLQPVDQLVLFLEGSIIGLRVESTLRFLSTEDMVVSKTLKWTRSPTCVCFYRGKLYAVSSSSTTVSVCNLDLKVEKNIFLSDMKSDSVLEIVVVMEDLYVCTKNSGQALVFSMTGSKKMEFKNAIQADAMAMSICIHERTELVFVSWNNFKIQLYSQKTSRCLRAIDMTEKLHKILVTTENRLVTLSASKCTVTVYDVGEVIKFDVFEKTIISSVKKKHQKKLMSLDEENLECHPANSETLTSISSPWKSASKQDKLEKVRDTKELHMKELEEIENLRRQYDRDTQKLNKTIKELEDTRTELESQQKKLKNDLDKEKRKVSLEERSRVQLKERIKELEDTRTELESQQKKLKNDLDEEKRKVSLKERSRVQQLKEKLTEQEGMKVELEGQQKKLKDNLDEEKGKLNERMKELEDTRTELESQQKKLKNHLDEEKRRVFRDESLRKQLKERIKELEDTRTELESQQKKLKDNLDEEKGKLNERIKELEDTRTELESQQMKLKNDLDEEKRKVSLKERSRVQDVIHLKKVEERNKKLEEDVVKLKDKLSQEERKAKEVQTSSLKAENARKILEQTKAMLEKEKIYMEKLLAAEERNETLLKKSLAKIETNLKEVEERNTKLEDEVTQFKERLLAEEKTAKGMQRSSLKQVKASQKELADKNLKLQKQNQYLNEILSTLKREALSQGMLSRYLSDAELDNVSCQRDTAINNMDELESVIAESVDTGIYSRTSHFEDMRVANGEQLNPDLKVAVTLTVKGAHMHIPDTGVELDIPTGAVRHKQLIEVTIIPFDKQFAPIENFSSNSSVVVELLPNKARFSLPVYLKLPHCLQLKGNYKDTKNPVKVFVSHHEEGPPVWKEDSSAKCTLEEDHCVIRLKHFCWVKYEINDKLVVAKRLKVFTAGKSLQANDSIAEIEVGYYMDLPGRAENMIATLGMEFYQNKPFVFVKEGKLSLQLVLSKIVPKEWTYITPNDNPKTISYKSVADDKDTSCPFALETSSSSPERKPFCIFKIVQGNESVELSMRF